MTRAWTWLNDQIAQMTAGQFVFLYFLAGVAVATCIGSLLKNNNMAGCGRCLSFEDGFFCFLGGLFWPATLAMTPFLLIAWLAEAFRNWYRDSSHVLDDIVDWVFGWPVNLWEWIQERREQRRHELHAR